MAYATPEDIAQARNMDLLKLKYGGNICSNQYSVICAVQK